MNTNWILVLDESGAASTAVRQSIQSDGHRALFISTPAQLSSALQRHPFDLVIVFVQQWEQYSAAQLNKIRLHLPSEHTALILLSDQPSSPDQTRCAGLDVDGCFSLPLNWDKIKQRLPASTTGHDATKNSDGDEPLIDREQGIALLGGDQSRYNRLLKAFVERYQHSATAIQQQIDEQQFDQATEWTHTIKGVAGNLALPPLFQSADRLNQQLKEQLDLTELQPFISCLEQTLAYIQQDGLAAPEDHRRPSTDRAHSSEQFTVLVVDDEIINVEVVQSALQTDPKYRILTTSSGEEAIRLAHTEHPCLILMDVVMKGMGGYQAVERLKTDPHTQSIPVIFLTAQGDTENIVKGFRTGGVDYITKPFVPEVLLARVNTHLQLYLLMQQKQQLNLELEKRVAKRTEQLTRSKQVKDDFLATMSHELRTPLATIIGNSELIEERKLTNAELMELAHSIKSAGKSQLAMVNDVLDMQKIESGKFSLDEAPFDLALLLKEVEHFAKDQTRQSNLHFRLSQQNREPTLLIGDEQRLRQILNNLINNGIKFTRQGEVQLTTAVDQDNLSFRVEDSGIGMSRETMNHLFKQFEQADGSISSSYGGTGLGLFIALNLAEMMGGTIDVSSQEGVGSTFTLVIPYRPSESPSSEAPKKITNRAHAQHYSGHVLVAEDTPVMQMLVRRILEKMGITVSIANNGKEALEAAQTTDYDLILMDMQMPVMDGVESTRLMREQGKKVPIVALTANVMQKHRDAFHQAGCNGFLSKPINNQELKRVLRLYLQTEKPPTETATKPSPKKQPKAQHSSGLEEFIDPELQKIFADRIKELKEQLVTALPTHRWDQIKEAAHVIKGSAQSFGFPSLTECGRAVCDAYDKGEIGKLDVLTTELIDEIINQQLGNP